MVTLARLPKHIALTVESLDPQDLRLILSAVEQCIARKIPVMSFLVLAPKMNIADFSIGMDSLAGFLSEVSTAKVIHENQVKVSILGKWYDLPGRVVDNAKKVIEETKDYDGHFLNLCINYDGQEEIVAACQLVAMQVKSERIDPLVISKEVVKENLYSSYFIPPDLLIKSGKAVLPSLLVWDSPGAVIYFTNRPWSMFTEHCLLEAIQHWSNC